MVQTQGPVAPEVRVEGDVVARETYRHLRLMLVTLSVLILVAMAGMAIGGTIEDSISSYYGQPIRNVFVGALVGIGVCLVVYRGFPPFEDYVLNLAGFFVVFVAFVPNSLQSDLAELTTDDRNAALFGLRISLGAAVLAAAALVLVEWRTGGWTVPRLLARPVTRSVLVLANVIGPAFLVQVFVTGFLRDDFTWVHNVAACLFFASLAMGVATHAWPTRLGGDGVGDRFAKVVFWAMLAGLALAAFLAWVVHSTYTVLVVELWEIGLFAAFWVRETVRTWRAAPPAPGALAA